MQSFYAFVRNILSNVENMSKILLFVTILCLSSELSSGSIISDLYSEDVPMFRDSRDSLDSTAEEFTFLRLSRSNDYSKVDRPGYSKNKNESYPLYINVSMDMLSLTELDETESHCTITMKMDLEWFDERLTSNNTGMLSLHPEHHQRIWHPNLRVPNIKEPGSLELNGRSNVMAFRWRPDGYIFIRSNFKLNLFCLLNFKSYPFDVQKCYIKLENRDYSDEEVIMLWHESSPFRNSDRFQLAGFSLLDYELLNDSVHKDLEEGEKVSRILVVLHVKRNWYHFLLDVYLPSALFVIMSWLSFWIEIPAAPARVTLGMTTMLTLVTSSTFSRERLPKVPYVHALDIWIGFCICFVFLSLIEYTFVSYLYQSDKSKRDRQKSLQKDLSALSLASMASHTISQYLDVPEINKSRVCLTIPELATGLRRLSDESQSSSASTADCSEILTLKQYKHGKRGSFLARMFQINCPNQELAQNIDRKCRLIFPLSFLLFNIIYWILADI